MVARPETGPPDMGPVVEMRRSKYLTLQAGGLTQAEALAQLSGALRESILHA